MVVMVTGSGMVGSQVAAQLVARGEHPVLFDVAPSMEYLGTIVALDKVRLVTGDILNIGELLSTIRSEKIDRIIHTAGFLLAGVRARPYAGTVVNFNGTLNVLEAARIAEVQRVVFASSTIVYYGTLHQQAQSPYDEDFSLTCLSGRPQAIYAITKLAGEYLGLSYWELYGVDFVAVRFAGVFGPWLGMASGIPGRVIDQFVKPALTGSPVVVDNPLLTYSGCEDFVYAKDAAYSAVLACFASKEYLKTRVYNVTMGVSYEFEEIVNTIKKIFPTVQITIKQVSKGGMSGLPYSRFYPFDISRAKTELGYEPRYDMERAILDYTEWLRQHYRT